MLTFTHCKETAAMQADTKEEKNRPNQNHTAFKTFLVTHMQTLVKNCKAQNSTTYTSLHQKRTTTESQTWNSNIWLRSSHHRHKPVRNVRVPLDRKTFFFFFLLSNRTHESKMCATPNTWRHSNFKQSTCTRAARGKMTFSENSTY